MLFLLFYYVVLFFSFFSATISIGTASNAPNARQRRSHNTKFSISILEGFLRSRQCQSEWRQMKRESVRAHKKLTQNQPVSSILTMPLYGKLGQFSFFSSFSPALPLRLIFRYKKTVRYFMRFTVCVYVFETRFSTISTLAAAGHGFSTLSFVNLSCISAFSMYANFVLFKHFSAHINCSQHFFSFSSIFAVALSRYAVSTILRARRLLFELISRFQCIAFGIRLLASAMCYAAHTHSLDSRSKKNFFEFFLCVCVCVLQAPAIHFRCSRQIRNTHTLTHLCI